MQHVKQHSTNRGLLSRNQRSLRIIYRERVLKVFKPVTTMTKKVFSLTISHTRRPGF